MGLKNFISTKISAKIVFILMAIIIVIMSVVSYISCMINQDKMTANLKMAADQIAERLSFSLVQPLWDYMEDQIATTLSLEIKNENVNAIVIKNKEGKFQSGNFKNSENIIVKLKAEECEKLSSFLKITREIKRNDAVIGSVELFITDKSLKQARADFIKTSAIQAVLLSIAILLAVFYSFKLIILTPIRTILVTVTQITQGNINVEKMTVASSDELGLLAAAINKMVDSLCEAENDRKKAGEERRKAEEEVRASEKRMKKNVDYQELEVNKLISNLENIAVGNFDIDMTIAPADKDTEEISEKFTKINSSLKTVKEAVFLLTGEVRSMSEAAINGKLQTRFDISRHKGEFKKVVKGLNDVFEAITTPVNEVRECLEKMAMGDLRAYVTRNYNGDHAILKNALNTTTESINHILGQVLFASDHVNNASRQLSDASQSLSQSSTSLASSLEEISASMHQINSQTRHNAENSVHANQMAQQTRVLAGAGNQKMHEMLRAMADINEAANGISKIIKAIDEIAFQTNLLALNAAVEAARAGKHGKGFTVVAEEVRSLAQRSAKAAKETAEMIEDSIKKAAIGTKVANDTSGALIEIETNVTKITDLVGEIASASKEQTQGINQINSGLSQVDQITQENTAIAEQSAATSEELLSQVNELKDMLTKFKLKDEPLSLEMRQ